MEWPVQLLAISAAVAGISTAATAKHAGFGAVWCRAFFARGVRHGVADGMVMEGGEIVEQATETDAKKTLHAIS